MATLKTLRDEVQAEETRRNAQLVADQLARNRRVAAEVEELEASRCEYFLKNLRQVLSGIGIEYTLNAKGQAMLQEGEETYLFWASVGSHSFWPQCAIGVKFNLVRQRDRATTQMGDIRVDRFDKAHLIRLIDQLGK